MKPAQKIALWADQLRHLSAMGLLFSKDPYDRRNYEQIQEISQDLMVLATTENLDAMQPLNRSLMRRPTPFATGDAAIIDDHGRILLIRRADNGKWAMPGGALEVGETPAEGVLREALEETGVRCEIVALAGLHDSRRVGAETPNHLYMIMFLCRPLSGHELNAQPATANEILERRWFAQDSLPPDVDPGHVTRIADAYRLWQGDGHPAYDR